MHAWLKFEGHSSKNEAATPLRSSKLKWAWRAQFLSHNLQILWKFIFFESLQMIVKPSLAISNSIEFGKKWSSPPSMCKGVLDLLNIKVIKISEFGSYVFGKNWIYHMISNALRVLKMYTLSVLKMLKVKTTLGTLCSPMSNWTHSL